MMKLLIIADDLTGANDTGVQFAKRGLKTVVVIDPFQDELERMTEGGVSVFNTDSRSLPPQESYDKMLRLTEMIKQMRGPVIIYKKIDSTLRGNVGVELDAMMDAGEFDLAVFAPAYPDNGRQTIGGYHLLHNVPLERTEIARDPKSPVHESHIPSLLRKQVKHQVGQIELKTIFKGTDKVAEALREQMNQGSKIMICDAFSNDDLTVIIQAVRQLDKKVLWVGSAGLANGLAGYIAGEQSAVSDAKGSPSPVLIVAGSVSAVTRKQIKQLQSSIPDIELVVARPADLANPAVRSGEINRISGLCAEAIRNGKDAVVTTDLSEEANQNVRILIRETGMTAVEAGNLIAASLGQAAAAAVQSSDPAGVVLTGGDIAAAACRELGVLALAIVGEVEEGIPVSTLIGGPKHGIPVVTKAGAFGNEESLVRAAGKIRKVKIEPR